MKKPISRLLFFLLLFITVPLVSSANTAADVKVRAQAESVNDLGVPKTLSELFLFYRRHISEFSDQDVELILKTFFQLFSPSALTTLQIQEISSILHELYTSNKWDILDRVILALPEAWIKNENFNVMTQKARQIVAVKPSGQVVETVDHEIEEYSLYNAGHIYQVIHTLCRDLVPPDVQRLTNLEELDKWALEFLEGLARATRFLEDSHKTVVRATVIKQTMFPIYQMNGKQDVIERYFDSELNNHMQKMSPSMRSFSMHVINAGLWFHVASSLALQDREKRVAQTAQEVCSFMRDFPHCLTTLIASLAIHYEDGISIKQIPEARDDKVEFYDASSLMINDPDGLQNCKNLKILNLNNNFLGRIPVAYLPHTLRSISVDGNYDVWFDSDKDKENRPAVMRLSMRNTGTRRFLLEKVFPNVREIDLSGSPITQIPEKITEKLKQLELFLPSNLLSEGEQKILDQRRQARLRGR